MFDDIQNLIWVEHRDRELGYASLVAEELLKAGLGTTIILSLPFHLPLAIIIAPRRVFVPFFKATDDESLILLGDRARQVVNFNYEQLLGNFNRGAKRPSTSGAIHLYWYDAFSEVLDFWAVPSVDRVRVPPPESHLVTKRAQKLGWHRTRDGKLHERIVFIPENYAWAFVDNITLSKKASAGFQIDQIRRLRDYSQSSLCLFIRQLQARCTQNPDVVFVLRPHPSVSVKSYEDEILRHGDLPRNLVISKEGSAWDWLGCSDAVISGWSTVTYSASQLGIPSALHHPIPLIPELNVPWVMNMPRFQDFQDAVRALLLQDSNLQNPYDQANGFDVLLERLARKSDYVKWSNRNGRFKAFIRAVLIAIIRHFGLIWQPSGVRWLTAYHADYFLPKIVGPLRTRKVLWIKSLIKNRMLGIK